MYREGGSKQFNLLRAPDTQEQGEKIVQVQVLHELSDEMEERLHVFHGTFEEAEPDKRTPEQRRLEKDKHSAEPYARLVALENDGTISGTLSLFQREVNVDGEHVRVGGIGGVATLKEKRGRGVATELLERAMEEMNKAGFDIAFLNTDVDDPKLVQLYEKVGFEIFDRSYGFRGKSGKEYEERSGMIAPLHSKQKMEKIKQSKKLFHLGEGNW